MDILKRLFIILFFITSFLIMVKVIAEPDFPDFRAHYFGAQRILFHQDPYTFDVHYFTNQAYPPLDYLVFIPFLFFPYEIAAKIWVILLILLLLGSLIVLFNISQRNYFSNESLLLSSFVFLSFPVRFSLGMGQINPFLFLFVVFIILKLLEKKDAFAGVLSAFIFQLKFFPLLFIPYLLAQKRFKYFYTVILTSIALICIMIVLQMVPENITFYKEILPGLLTSWKDDYYNQAISGVISRSTDSEELRQFLKIMLSMFLLITTGLVVFIKRRVKKYQYLILTTLLTLSLLINNFSWQHHFIFLIPSFFAVYYFIKENKRSTLYLILLFFAYILVSLNLKEPQVYPVIVQSHVFYGGLLLLLLQLLLLRKNE